MESYEHPGLARRGLIAGIVAHGLAPGLRRFGLALSTLLGIAGSLLVGRTTRGLQPAALLGSIAGAILLLALASAVAGRRRLRL